MKLGAKRTFKLPNSSILLSNFLFFVSLILSKNFLPLESGCVVLSPMAVARHGRVVLLNLPPFLHFSAANQGMFEIHERVNDGTAKVAN